MSSAVALLVTAPAAASDDRPAATVDLLSIADGCTGEGCREPITRREMAGWVVEVLIDAGRAELAGHAGRFEDVEVTDPWAAHIETFAALGITDGCSREHARFCPDRSVTRGQMAVFLVRAVGLPDPLGEPRAFGDVAEDHHYRYAIRRLAAACVTVGYSDGTYRPDAEVSRWHMSLFLARAAAYSWGTWSVLSTGRADEGCTATFAHSLTDNSRTAVVPCTVLDEGDTFSVIGFQQRLQDWARAAPCENLRRTFSGYVYPGAAPQRVEVTAVTVAFDDLPAPGERYIRELGAQPEQRFIDELLAAVETKLEALSHGRTDWVFRRGGEVTLSGSAHSRARPASLGRQTLSGVSSEVRALFPDDELLLALHTVTQEFPYAGFYGRGGVAVTSIEAEDDPYDNPYPGQQWVGLDADAWADIDAYSWSHARFGWALGTAAHELLHHLGLEDLYPTTRDDGRGPPDRDSGQDSMMGMSSYGWGLGSLSAESIAYGGPGSGGVTLSQPSARYPHEPLTGWNKWLLGWLDGPEAVCVSPDETTTVVVRPHQLTTLNARPYGTEQRCWDRDWEDSGGSYWGTAAPNPAIAIVPTSDSTAVVIEADPFAARGPPGVPQCFIGELPYSPYQCAAPDDYDGAGHAATRSTRPVGDIIVYDVDLMSHHRPQLLVSPTVAVVSSSRIEQLTPVYGPTGLIGKHYAPVGQFANETIRGPWPNGLPIECYYATEVTIHGHRISVAASTVTDDGQPQVTVTVEPA
ncbi:MAG: hypothetical protein F4110_04440 [Acidimicrobiaceae bacterium]|nr:hypothetical protein [Acidimicrobiaceae bacterium]MYI53221.1 hypothetical protein [Acidimicrobiaceae bacterium]